MLSLTVTTLTATELAQPPTKFVHKYVPANFPIRNPCPAYIPPAGSYRITRLVFSHLPASPVHSPMWCAWHAISSGRCSSPHPSCLREQKSEFATNFIQCTYLVQAMVPESICEQALKEARHHAREWTTLPILQSFSV